MEQYRGTTILSVRRNGKVVIGGDGQVSLGNTIMKGNARKVRRLYNDKVIAGFAGGTADAFTLFEALKPNSSNIKATSLGPRWSWPKTGAAIVSCANSKPCLRWLTVKPR